MNAAAAPAAHRALLLPLVVCASQGGRYDDEAFGAGVECGRIYAELGQCESIGAHPRPRYLPAGILTQVELIAMRYGYSVTTDKTAGGWVRASFERP